MAEDYVIKPGDCVLSVAQERGFLWQTVWKHPKNQPLARQRQDPNVVMPGDVLHLPDRVQKEEPGGTEEKHVFRTKGRKARLRLRLTRSVLDETLSQHAPAAPGEFIEPAQEAPEVEPEDGVPYALYVDGALVARGETDQDGMVDETLPPHAKLGRLVLNPGGGTSERIMDLNLGHMDPLEETVGVCKRLANLGYDCPEDAQDDSRELAGAVEAFQRDHDLEVTGKIDGATRARLGEIHGA